MINRGKLDQPVQEEFEHLIARLRGFLSQSFDEDGTLILPDPVRDVVPVGSVLLFAGTTTVPDGFLVCDGTAVSRAVYYDLFQVIGTTYGAGDGLTTFNLPTIPPVTLARYIIHTGVFRPTVRRQRRF